MDQDYKVWKLYCHTMPDPRYVLRDKMQHILIGNEVRARTDKDARGNDTTDAISATGVQRWGRPRPRNGAIGVNDRICAILMAVIVPCF